MPDTDVTTSRADGERPSATLTFLRAARVVALLVYSALCLWTMSKLGVGAMDGGPDEAMRALLPQAMINGNLLPSGYDPEVIYGIGNWSYAFYPQMLGAYLSAFFMKAAQIMGLSHGVVFMSGRLASLVFGLVSIVCVSGAAGTVAERAGGGERLGALTRLIATSLLAFWPQFAFLSSYMNNDVVAFCGCSIIVYALCLGMGSGWNYRRSALLGAGVTVAALGYWNAYGFVLLGIVLYLYSCLTQNPLQGTRPKLIALAAGIPAVCVLPFFAVNLVRYHDLLGIGAFKAEYQRWLDDGGEVLQVPYEKGVCSLLLDTDWTLLTLRSFVGFLGYMSISLPFTLVAIIFGTALLGLGAFLGRHDEFLRARRARVLTVGCALASATCVALSIYYSIQTDLQPQGRYVIYCLLPLVVASSVGLASLVRRATPRQVAAVTACCALIACVTVWFFASSAAQYGWAGMA